MTAPARRTGHVERRPFDGLGRFATDWLEARYHFSFADYVDPARMGFGALRVWNDDRIAPGTGFPPHPHREMEIVTFVRRGAITHEDSLGNRGRTAAGDVQVMSAGTGIRHAEYNLEDAPVEVFQIWIQPAEARLTPRWETRHFPRSARAGRLVPLASGRAGMAAEGEGAPLHIQQDATLFAAALRAGEAVRHRLDPGRRAYLVPVEGGVTVCGTDIEARDGAAVTDTETIEIAARQDCDLLLFDLA